MDTPAQPGKATETPYEAPYSPDPEAGADAAPPRTEAPGEEAPRSQPLGPALMVVLGSACTSSSGGLIKLSGVSAGTAAFYRCVIALLVLAPLAYREIRRRGARPPRLQLIDLAAGLLLGVDFVCWAQSIDALGASIATVLLNIQLVVFPLLARLLSGTALSRGYWVTVPFMLLGVALAGGAIGDPQPGSDPGAGVLYGTAAGVAFAGYLFLIRLGGEVRGPGKGRPIQPVCVSTAGAAVSAAVLGSLWTGLDFAPAASAWGWLVPMALFGQVLAWLFINPALPRLSPSAGSALLLLQPVLAMLFGIGFLGERPGLTQYAGCALVVLVVWRAGRADR
ncbi:DMT family transporter [Streptomyces sp. ODS28]|uniref:DMT family transporter n=1 Tax=Streptomyces sp. ODS28 TaxID=3136688 RepID=UPI0031EA2E0D